MFEGRQAGKQAGDKPYSSGVMRNRSFRSAPAQKAASTSLAIISARVAPFSPSAWMLPIWCESSLRSWVEIALRAEGRLRDRMRMLPLWGAGIVRMVSWGDGVVLVMRVRWWEGW